MAFLTIEDRASKLTRYASGFVGPVGIGMAVAVIVSVDDGLTGIVPFLLGLVAVVGPAALRALLAAVLQPRLGVDRTIRVGWWSYGLPDELARLLLVVLAAPDLQSAVLIGLGWGVGECGVGRVNLRTLAGLMTKDDPKSMEFKRSLWPLGFLTPHHPRWAALEGLGILSRHLGFTLLLFTEPLLVLVAIPLHLGAVLASVRFTRSHFALTEAALAGVSVVVLATGLVLAFG